MNKSTLPSLGESKPSHHLPSVDSLLGATEYSGLISDLGRPLVKRAIQKVLASFRDGSIHLAPSADASQIFEAVRSTLGIMSAPRLFPVINLTGTVIHTNLGRSIMGPEVAQAVSESLQHYNALEFNLLTGDRGDRDSIVEELICRLTGAEAATVVNNCAAAVLLSLVALGARREVVISRGEQIEIGGAFRMPDIMRAANCRLVEVGTTNRTHLRDYENAITPKTSLIVKAHRSNYAVTGFTAEVGDIELGALAQRNGLDYMVDLGSGALVDMSRFGLAREPLPSDSLKAGASVVMFSGDKLLGGPQAGIIVGTKTAIAKIKRHPLKRTVRVSKIVMAALEATLRIYDSDHELQQRLPVLSMLTRPPDQIQSTAERIAPTLLALAGPEFQASVVPCHSQIGSGALPEERLPSFAVELTPMNVAKPAQLLKKTLTRLRTRRPAIIGRVRDDKLVFDCRCLLPADETLLVRSLR